MSKISDKTIKTFLEELSSKAPTPGGGAVAALAGAMAASLVEMVMNLTPGGAFDLATIGKARALRAQLLELSDEDVKAFDAVMKAYRSKDKLAIKKTLLKAIEIPTQTKRLARLVGELAREAVRKGNKNAISDAKTAIYLAEAAGKSAEENIKINKESLAKLE
jgi:formiminotetrahydrofolate cyclodeaminase